jgi:hypothetical protein
VENWRPSLTGPKRSVLVLGLLAVLGLAASPPDGLEVRFGQEETASAVDSVRDPLVVRFGTPSSPPPVAAEVRDPLMVRFGTPPAVSVEHPDPLVVRFGGQTPVVERVEASVQLAVVEAVLALALTTLLAAAAGYAVGSQRRRVVGT